MTRTVVHVDLTRGTVRTEEAGEDLIRQVLGGFGFNTHRLHRRLPKGADPLGPENILLISRGLLTGSPVPASSRIHVSAKSPLSGLMGSSSVGGHIGRKLRSLGIFALEIQGRAPTPTVLTVDASGISLHDAGETWGLDTRAAETALRQGREDKLTEILSIGRAGENRVVFACIMNGPDHAAGRTGMGAVMGSKKLKAVVVEGIKAKETPSRAVRELVKAYTRKIRNSGSIYTDFSTTGSSGHVRWLNDAGQLGTCNYRQGAISNVDNIDGRHLTTYVRKKTSCHRCPVHCKADISIPSGRHKGFRGGRPEYETVINMGSLCGLNDPEELLFLSNLANILGLDTISTGSVIAFAMDLFDRGILTPEETGGLDLTWGNARAMETLMHWIADGTGLGRILAKGVRSAARIIGKGAEQYAFHAKGVEIYGADPRGAQAIALTYAVSLRGGDFTSVYPVPAYRYTPERAADEFGTSAAVDPRSPKGKAQLVKRCLLVSAVVDALGLCKVPALSCLCDFSLENESALIKAITGLDLSPDDLMHIGERIINMEKCFNLAHGADSSHDNLPALFRETGLDHGPVKGQTVTDLPDMVAEFYRIMGWDENGVPRGHSV